MRTSIKVAHYHLVSRLNFTTGLAAVFIISANHAWHSVGHFFTVLTAAGLIGALGAIAATLLAGGFITIRRVTV